MDKFVVRTRIKRKIARKDVQPEIKLKQARIIDLKGVVNVDDLKEIKTVLKTETDPEILVKNLTMLSAKLPCVEVLISTKIGNAVQNLKKHNDRDVSNLAGEIVNKWTEHIRRIRTRKEIDVKCDTETENLRQKAREMITEAFDSHETAPDTILEHIAASLERTIFVKMAGKRIKNGYARIIRQIVGNLKNGPHLRGAVLNDKEKACDDMFVKSALK